MAKGLLEAADAAEVADAAEAAEAAAPAAEAAAEAAAAEAAAAEAAAAVCRGEFAVSARLERAPITLTDAGRQGRVDQVRPGQLHVLFASSHDGRVDGES